MPTDPSRTLSPVQQTQPPPPHPTYPLACDKSCKHLYRLGCLTTYLKGQLAAPETGQAVVFPVKCPEVSLLFFDFALTSLRSRQL
jgi:hypothetical protein